MWYVSIMSNFDLLISKFVILEAALLFAGVVVAYPAWAKDEPKYVGDFDSTTTRKQVQIIDDGPVNHQYRDAPVSAVVIPPLSTSPKPAELQSRTSGLCEPLPVSKSSRNARPFDSSRGPIGDFPLEKLNFPREVGPAGKYALPMTSPRVMSAQAKPMGVGGAARKGEAPRLSKPTSRRASATPIRTYSRGYVSGGTSTEDKSKGFR